jgi:3-phenylpropionate/trans-cinnamate dioxygenase ferredoxin reductase subunit
MQPAIIVVGAGQAGFQTVASLRRNGFDGRLVLIGDEPDPPYQRPPLSKAYLKQPGFDPATLRFRKPDFFAANDIELITEETVREVVPGARRVVLGSGSTLDYRHLVLATGARNRMLPLAGGDQRVVGLRTLADARRIRDRLGTATRVVIVGAGFIGLEVAATARALGLEVVVVEAAARVMARALSPAMSAFFAAHHRATGIEIRLETLVTGLSPGGKGVVTKTGEVLPADLILVGIGVLPNQELAAAAGLPTADGILVDRRLLTGDPAISAIGDCARFPSAFATDPVRLESVQNAVDQGKCVADRLTGRAADYDAVPWFWSDQGPLKLQLVGLTSEADDFVTLGAPDALSFSVLCFRAGRLVGIESVNCPGDHMAGRRLLGAGTVVTPEAARRPAFDLKAAAPAQPGARARPRAPS